MAHNISRLTLYALISSIEEDFRRIIVTFSPSQGVNSLGWIPEDMTKKIVGRANKDQASGLDLNSLDQIIVYADLGDSLQILRIILKDIPESISEQIKDNHKLFEDLIPVRNRVMHGRPLEFDDLAKTTDLVDKLLTNRAHWESLNETYEKLRLAPEYVLKLSIPAESNSSRISNNLPLPDYDETGFIGRKETLHQLMKACLGTYPVITIVGEGGLGKTSLALKIAYDLLDSDASQFDAIIFVSAKTAQLTSSEIIRIEGAINNSIGLIKSAADALAGEISDGTIKSLIELLNEFNVLLILDNLETVLDKNIKELLQSLPRGSKLLITTRIGIGAFEYPIQVPSLSDVEAVQLLRAVAKIRGCQKLVQTNNDKLTTYCTRMRNSPLHIKWFVSAVQAGKRPEEVLSDEKIFLQFCLSNVFDGLSDFSRKLVRTLLVVGGSYTVAELVYLTEIDEDSVLKGIQELTRTNMFFISSSPISASYESRFELSQLAKAYLNRFYPVNKEETRRVLGLKKSLISAGEKIVSEAATNPLSPYTISCRSRSDWVVAKYLQSALKAAGGDRYEDSYEYIEKAKKLSPDFSEILRVEAFIHANHGNLTSAIDSYEKAIELDPSSASTRLQFGGFLLRDAGDTEKALEQYKIAMDLAPDLPSPVIEYARCCMYRGDYAEAEKSIQKIFGFPGLGERGARIVRDLGLQLNIRKAEMLALNKEPINALQELKIFKEKYSSIDFVDEKMRRKIHSAMQVASSIRVQLSHSVEKSEELNALYDWLNEVNFSKGVPDDEADSARNISINQEFDSGQIIRLSSNMRFGFIKSIYGNEIFFHVTSIISDSLSSNLQVGIKVKYRVTVDKASRLVAIDLEPVL